jgi:hypothetical protein
MPNPKTDSGGFSTENSDRERDMGAKGGPTTSLGSSDDHHTIAAPYDADLQTQLAAKGGKKDKEKGKDKNKKENP